MNTELVRNHFEILKLKDVTSVGNTMAFHMRDEKRWLIEFRMQGSINGKPDTIQVSYNMNSKFYNFTISLDQFFKLTNEDIWKMDLYIHQQERAIQEREKFIKNAYAETKKTIVSHWFGD